MGTLYYALNHEKKAAFEFGKFNFCANVEGDIKQLSVEQLTDIIWDRIDPARNYTVDFTRHDAETYAKDLHSFQADEIVNDMEDSLYETYGKYMVTHSIYVGAVSDIGQPLNPSEL